jgi:chromosome segregation ATPase
MVHGRIKDREDELDIRNKKIEKIEGEYKLDLKNIESKNDEIRSKNRELIEKETYLHEKEQELIEKERELDKLSINSSKEFDENQRKIQDKINNDIERLSIKEKELESEQKRLKEKESKIESDIIKLIEESKTKIYNDLESELLGIENDIRNIYKLANDLIEFNHPFVEKKSKEMISEINKLKNRIDNNLIN